MEKAENASFENECYVDVEWGSTEDSLQPAIYVEHWGLPLWDKVFRVYFDNKDNLTFVEGLNLMEFEEGPIAIKQVVYWETFDFSFSLYCLHFLSYPPPFSSLMFFILQVHLP